MTWLWTGGPWVFLSTSYWYADAEFHVLHVIALTSLFTHTIKYGRTPFKGKHRNETFHNILHKELAFPCDTSSAHFVVSPAAQNLMRRLLVKNPSNRLGSKFGGGIHVRLACARDQTDANATLTYPRARIHALFLLHTMRTAEVKAQTWFRPIDWALLRNQRPPIIPQLANRYDTSHFRNYFKQVSFFCSGGGSGSGENDDGAIATSRMIADLPVEDGIAWETVEDALRRDAAREKHGLPIVDGSATFEEEDRASSDASVRANVSDDMDEHDLGDAATRHKDPFADFRAISILHDVESE